MPKYAIVHERHVHQRHRVVIEVESESAARQSWIDGLDTEVEDIDVTAGFTSFTLMPDDTPLAPAPATERIYLASIDHKMGTNHYADRTEDGLFAKLAEFCRDWAEHEQVDISACTNDREVVEAYFHDGAEEWVSFGHEDLPL